MIVQDRAGDLPTRPGGEAVRHRELLLDSCRELRNPLTVLSGYVDVLLQDLRFTASRQRASSLRAMRHECDRMGLTVQDVLSWYQIERHGRLDIRPRDEDVAAILLRCVERQRPCRTRHPLELTVLPDLPTARVDRGRVFQAVSILLSNAVKFSPGGGAIHVVAFLDGPSIRVEVHDHGLGMSVEERARLFQPFFHAHPERGGSGLGLYIFRHIVAAHGGSWGAESVLGQGSTFWWTLPLEGTP